ncbi:MAG: hypothetical protein DLM72_19305 [Candidatus Nitrosopolaris wilkensis]|nr:MAG: hypothetical protein DLM72_19305 [Candidatus Nitrosopolaris wilkensis]
MYIHPHIMARRSKKSIAEISTPRLLPPLVAQPPSSSNDDNYDLLERKITLAIEGFTTVKFCELILRDRNRLSKENALTICAPVGLVGKELLMQHSWVKKTSHSVPTILPISGGCLRLSSCITSRAPCS